MCPGQFEKIKCMTAENAEAIAGHGTVLHLMFFYPIAQQFLCVIVFDNYEVKRLSGPVC